MSKSKSDKSVNNSKKDADCYLKDHHDNVLVVRDNLLKKRYRDFHQRRFITLRP
ncbi:MAG: hypothetical protein AB7V56_07705 [Candidatus Nitrosocosmicus sp.]